MEQLSQFGTWFHPEAVTAFPAAGNTRGAVVFFPPATGFSAGPPDEARALVAAGFSVLHYEPPYAHPRNQASKRGGLEDPVGEAMLWDEARVEWGMLLQLIQAQFAWKSAQVQVVGKNLGGSVAAYAVGGRARSLTVAGSVPELSEFLTRSAHPVAASGRGSLSSETLERYREQCCRFDLLQTLPQLSYPLLIQIGRKDDWISLECAHKLTKLNGYWDHPFAIQWTEDDHKMESADSIRLRREFLLSNEL